MMTRQMRRQRALAIVTATRRATKLSRSRLALLDCFASLAMTARGQCNKKAPEGAFRFNGRWPRSVCVGPDLLLGEVKQSGENDQEDHHLQAELLARFEMRLRCPHQERRDVLGIVLDLLRGAVVIGHLIV